MESNDYDVLGLDTPNTEWVTTREAMDRFKIAGSTLYSKLKQGRFHRNGEGKWNSAEIIEVMADPKFQALSAIRGHRSTTPKARTPKARTAKVENVVKKPGGYIDLTEAARLTRESKSTLQTRIYAGKLEAIKVQVGPNEHRWMVARTDVGLPPLPEAQPTTPVLSTVQDSFLALAELVRSGNRRVTAFTATVEYTVNGSKGEKG